MGINLNLESCIKCGKNEHIKTLNGAVGGLICSACYQKWLYEACQYQKSGYHDEGAWYDSGYRRQVYSAERRDDRWWCSCRSSFSGREKGSVTDSGLHGNVPRCIE